jgi:hypothetical protein
VKYCFFHTELTAITKIFSSTFHFGSKKIDEFSFSLPYKLLIYSPVESDEVNLEFFLLKSSHRQVVAVVDDDATTSATGGSHYFYLVDVENREQQKKIRETARTSNRTFSSRNSQRWTAKAPRFDCRKVVFVSDVGQDEDRCRILHSKITRIIFRSAANRPKK